MSQIIIIDRLRKLVGAKETPENIRRISAKFKLIETNGNTKFNNMKIMYKDDRYDSLSEAYYAVCLEDLLVQGHLQEIKRQVPYKLNDMDGKPRLRYVADFVVTLNSGEKVVLDVKGRLLPENKIKLGYVRFAHNIKVILIPTSGPDKFNFNFL